MSYLHYEWLEKQIPGERLDKGDDKNNIYHDEINKVYLDECSKLLGKKVIPNVYTDIYPTLEYFLKKYFFPVYSQPILPQNLRVDKDSLNFILIILTEFFNKYKTILYSPGDGSKITDTHFKKFIRLDNLFNNYTKFFSEPTFQTENIKLLSIVRYCNPDRIEDFEKEFTLFSYKTKPCSNTWLNGEIKNSFIKTAG